MKNRIPISCRIKNKLVLQALLYRSPSAFGKCEYGFRGNFIKCMNCSKRKDNIGKYIIPPTIDDQN